MRVKVRPETRDARTEETRGLPVPGTRGTRDPLATGPGSGGAKTEEIRGFQAAGTRGTRGTRENDDVGGNAEGVPTEAAALLRYLRDDLHCLVWLDAEVVRIGPTHRCPPRVVAAALAVVGELRALLDAEGEALIGGAGEPTETEAGWLLGFGRHWLPTEGENAP